jgi:hypothetical protein
MTQEGQFLMSSPDQFLMSFDRDSKTGEIEPWAREIVDRFATYTEVSPSGSGLKAFYRYDPADLPRYRDTFNPGADWGRDFGRGDHYGPDVHLGGRWYAVTGDRLPGSPAELREMPVGDLLWLLTEAGPRFKATGGEVATVDRSAVLHGIACQLQREGATFETFTQAAMADPEARGHVEKQRSERVRERLLQRQWKRAGEAVAKQEAERLADLDDLDAMFVSSPPTGGLPSALARMNATYGVGPVGGHERIIMLRGRQDFAIGTAEDLRLRHRPERVTVGDKRRPLADVWLECRNRRAYPEGLVFLPGREAPAGAFNTWRAWAVDPDPLPAPEQRCPRVLEHLRLVFGEHADWGFDWLAHLFQRPWQKPGTTIILRGDEGAGKDLPAEYLGRILRVHYAPVADPKHLTGAFNGHLARAVLVHASDSVWGGDRAAGGKLRAMVTQTRLPLELKGQDAVMVDSFARFWISTNATWAIEAARESRRWFVVEVPSDWKGDRAYFDGLAAEMDGGGPAALLAWLLARGVTSDLRKAPETAALRQQRIESLRGPDAWIAACVESGEILGANPLRFNGSEWPEFGLRADWLREACEMWLRGGRHRGDMTRPEAFGRAIGPFTAGGLTKLPRNGDRVQPRGYRMRPLAECRDVLARVYGGAL